MSSLPSAPTLTPLPKPSSSAATKWKNSANTTAPKSNVSAPSLSLASSITPSPLHPPPGFTLNPWIPWKKAPTNPTPTPPSENKGKNAYALSVLRRVEMKIDGRDISESREIDIAEQ
ncbi:hypothetical protein LR48_Vigan10g117800 [Vigna angularis]|nr:extensin [Vigna angularis]KOM55286.1 hypothetical protein LR48_Vigan10g117800 [Vigna angularis]BAU02171.1 hypothetical protein VIGAN_11162100 [Vigna angularis var. angularis]